MILYFLLLLDGNKWATSSRKPSLDRYRRMPRSSRARGCGSLDGATAKGKTKTAPVTTGKDGAERIRDESGTYVARYRDGDGFVVEVSTGCRDKTAAQNVLADLERKAERVRAGLLTPAEARTAEHLATPIGEHVDAYIDSLEASGVEPRSMSQKPAASSIGSLEDCEFRTLADLDRRSSSDGSTSDDRAGCIGSNPQCRPHRAHRLRQLVRQPERRPTRREPVQRACPKADEKADPRRTRRAMTEAELVRLLDVARRRPLLEAMTVRTGQAEGASHRQRSTRSAGATRSARPRASPDLQDARSDRTPEERTRDP